MAVLNAYCGSGSIALPTAAAITNLGGDLTLCTTSDPRFRRRGAAASRGKGSPAAQQDLRFAILRW